MESKVKKIREKPGEGQKQNSKQTQKQKSKSRRKIDENLKKIEYF